jgi:hypothetical protein
MRKRMLKTSGHDVTKGLKISMGQKFPVFIEKMDVKYFMKNCDQGTKCHTVGMAKNAVGGIFTCYILPP